MEVLSLLSEKSLLIKLIIVYLISDCYGRSVPVTDNSLADCLKSPDTVTIDCHLVNVKVGKCIEKNVISIPANPDNANGEINCTSHWPIDLSFEGYQLDDFTNVSFVRNAENVFNEATYIFSISFPLLEVKAAREVVVSRYGYPEQKLTFMLFRPDKSHIFSTNLKFQPSSSDKNSVGLPLEFAERELIIPCLPNDPNVSTPSLETPSGMAKAEKRFDYRKGFIIKTCINQTLMDASGMYICKAKRDGYEEEILQFEVDGAKDTSFEPLPDKVYLLENSELFISCKAKEGVVLEGKFKGKEIVPRPVVSYTSVLQFESQYSDKLVKVGDSGQITCKTLEKGDVLKTWDIETLDIKSNSILQVTSASDNEVTCKSYLPTEKMKLQMIFCQGETECKLNEFCFNEKEQNNSSLNHTSCLKTLQGIPCTDSDPNSLCLKLPQNSPDHSQGVIRCNAGNYSYQSNFFVGFDKKLYLNWKEAPLSALIDIFVPNVTMYPQMSYPFGCRAVKFISDGKLQWVIKGKDGSEILLHKNRLEELRNHYVSELDYKLYAVRESNIKLIYPNDYDIICMIPMWNATGWVRHHKRINVAAKEAPIAEIVSTSAAVILILLGVVVYVMWRLKKAKDAIRNLTEKEVQEFLEGNPEALKNASDKEVHEIVDCTPYNKEFEIPREKLLIDSGNILGKGAFGTVLKGRVDGIPNMVAVKTVNSDCEVNRFKGFLSELKIMIYIGKHPNIVSLIGASTEKIKEKTLYIVVEFCANGSLESYLRKWKGYFIDQIINNEILPGITTYENLPTSSVSSSGEGMMTTVNLLRWSYQIAHGMEYLAEKRVIHADLAARNVLIDCCGNAKITDFGLSRQLFDYTQYVKKQQEPLPWRWMAIESLQQLRFSTQSDVWAYGILLWEIFSVGDMPYPGLSWSISFVQQLANGLRLIKPSHSTDGIYNVMLDCWQEAPEKRPSFTFLAQYFKAILETLNMELEESQGVYEKTTDSEVTPGYLMLADLSLTSLSQNDKKLTNIYTNF